MRIVLLFQKFFQNINVCVRQMFASMFHEWPIVYKVVAGVVRREQHRVCIKGGLFFLYSYVLVCFLFWWDNWVHPIVSAFIHAVLMTMLLCCGLTYQEFKKLMVLKRKSALRLLISHFGMVLIGYLFLALLRGFYSPLLWPDFTAIALSFSDLVIVMGIVRAIVVVKL